MTVMNASPRNFENSNFKLNHGEWVKVFVLLTLGQILLNLGLFPSSIFLCINWCLTSKSISQHRLEVVHLWLPWGGLCFDSWKALIQPHLIIWLFHLMLQLHRTMNSSSRCCLSIITFGYSPKGYTLHIPFPFFFFLSFCLAIRGCWICSRQMIICIQHHKSKSTPKWEEHRNLYNKWPPFQHAYNSCAVMKTRILFCGLAIPVDFELIQSQEHEGSRTEFRASDPAFQTQAFWVCGLRKMQPNPQDWLSPVLLFCIRILIFVVYNPFPWQTVSCEGRDHILHPRIHLPCISSCMDLPPPEPWRCTFASWVKHFPLTSIKSGCRILGLDVGPSFIQSLCVRWLTKMSCNLKYYTARLEILCSFYTNEGAAARSEKWPKWGF